MNRILLAGLAFLTLAMESGLARADDLVAAVLPSSRSGVINQAVTVFATLINTSGSAATGCTVTTSQSGVTLDFWATDPATNLPVGTANTPLSIPDGMAQSLLLSVTSSVALQAVDVPLTFDCTGLQPAAIISGLDTLLLTISGTTQPADIVALSLTAPVLGVVSTGSETGTGAFVVASIDVGAGATITVMPNTGDLTNLPVALTICQTDATGMCMAAPTASVTNTYTNFSVATFAVFVTASGPVPFAPASNRVFVDFTDSNNVVRGQTSVALEVPTTTPTTATPGGIYVGVFRLTSAPAMPQPVMVMVSETGEFHLLPGNAGGDGGDAEGGNHGPIMRETLQLTAAADLSLTGTGNDYAAGDGPTAETGAVTATGSFSPRRTLVLNTQDGTQTGIFHLNYVRGLYEKPSSLAGIAGAKTLRDEAGNSLGTITINTDGSFSAMTTAGCTETGSFTIIDPSFSLLGVSVSEAACGTAPAATFTGLAMPQGGNERNGILTTEVSNPTTAIANIITSHGNSDF